jgi:S1-C subfamily serine protease
MWTRQGWSVYPLAGAATLMLAAGALQHAARAERPVRAASWRVAASPRVMAAASVRTVADTKRTGAAKDADKGEVTALPGGMVTVDAYEDGDDSPTHRRGTGVLASHSGHVFVPLFVVADADVVIVNFGGDKRSPARVLATDAHSQLAILKVMSPPESMSCPSLCGGAGEQANTSVVMYSPDGAKCRKLSGAVVGMRDKAGPLADVLEVTLRGAPGEMGGVILTSGGDLVGLALATIDGQAGGGAHVLVLPASQIRQAMDRILKGTPGTDTHQERPVSVA